MTYETRTRKRSDVPSFFTPLLDALQFRDARMELLAGLHGQGQAILLVTHDAKLATRHAARVISVMDGLIVDDARLDEVERRPADVIRVRGEEAAR